MDPNPKSFPLLSFVLSHFPTKASRPPDEPHDDSCSGDDDVDVDLVERLTCLHPELLASMASVVSDVAQARSVLRLLGDRPDRQAVDAARASVAAVASDLSRQLEEIVRAPRPDAVDRLRWRAEQAVREKECRAKAEEEKAALRAVIQLGEMHEAYERVLRDAENRLVKMADGGKEDGSAMGEGEKEVPKEEVIGILQREPGKGLERVNLSSRQLSCLPEAFWNLRGLRYLNLSNNQFVSIPGAIGGLQCLDELYLSSNTLILLPDSIGQLLNLKILDVSRNKLQSLPPSIPNCRSLVELDASYNGLTYLPTNIGELQRMQKLRIHLNKIRSLPSSTCEMRALRLLDAHFNELQGLPYSFGRLTNLETLDLSGNFSDLQKLPPTFGDLTNLKELDLSNNQIHKLPNAFGRLDKLTKLNLDQNPLVVPPMDIALQGVEAVKVYMSKRMFDNLLEEDRSVAEEDSPTQAGWLTRSTSWLNNWVSEYIGSGEHSQRDSYLDLEL